MNITSKEKFDTLCRNAISDNIHRVHVYSPVSDKDEGNWFFYKGHKCYFPQYSTVYAIPEQQDDAWKHIQQFDKGATA